MPTVKSDRLNEPAPAPQPIDRPAHLERACLARPRAARVGLPAEAGRREQFESQEPERWDGMS